LPDWLEILVLAVASSFWPTLILIVVLALRLERPIGVLVWFLVAGLLTTISIGIAIVFALQDSSFVSGSHPPANPALELTAGLLSLLAAYALLRGSRKAPPAKQAPTQPSKLERTVGRGGPVVFAAGVVLNIIPGAAPLVGLKDIAQLDAGNGAKVAAIIVFYLIMFAFIEVPIVAYGFAPRRTAAEMNRVNAWVGRNARQVAGYVIGAVGLYLTVRGLVHLFD
jgi:Sap, sulfolipid-1-addressing protein